MSDLLHDRSSSIIETSLTELAFIFFFILLTVSAWKLNASAEGLKSAEEKQETLSNQVAELQESLEIASEYMAVSKEYDPEELFQELSAGKQAAEKLKTVLQEKSKLQDQLNSLNQQHEQVAAVLSLYDGSKGPREIATALEQHKEIVEALNKHVSERSGVDPIVALESLIQQHGDIKGQNINLRNKLANLGNGLDHPPCWADPQTGSIEYVFDVVINEGAVVFHPGWPDSRAIQAQNNPNISSIPGEYIKNASLWEQTQGLYEESVKADCRHFVRVYDHAESKVAFKQYLLGIETHFYKFLSTRPYL